MKKIYTIIVAMLIFAGAYAQNESTHWAPFPGNQWTSPKALSHFNEKSTQMFWINLDSADAYYAINNGLGYSRFAWNANEHYVRTDTAGGHYGLIRDLEVSFDTLVDPYNPIPVAYSRNNATVAIDSIILWCGQVNYSGIDDTIILKIVDVKNGTYFALEGYADTAATGANVYWADTIIIPHGSPLDTGVGGSFNGFLLGVPVNLNLTGVSPSNKFAVQAQYWGNKQDTFMFVAGCPSFAGAVNCTGFTMADTSWYYGNTIVNENDWNAYYPTNTGGFLYYDCNGTTGFQYGIDGSLYTQDADIWVKVSYTVGIQENKALGIKLNQNIPNPFNNTTDITYQLAKRAGNVTLEVTDLTGRVVNTINEGAKDSGKYTITLDSKNLSQGAYFYTLTVDGYRLTNKMIVTK